MPRGGHQTGSSRKAPPAGRTGAPAAPRPFGAALTAALCAGLFLVTFAAFGGLLSSGFLNYDDQVYVTENAPVLKGLCVQSAAWAFTATRASNWHPLTWISHMLDVQLFGMDAGRHHLTSLLLHALSAVLLLLLLFRMTGALWRSALVAALFALHPLHVESVAWIAERKDVLSTFFWLLTLGAWLSHVRSKKAAPYLLALVFYALGLMAKPMLVTLPFTLLLADFWPLQRLALPLRRHLGVLKGLLWEKAPFFALSAASCAITFMVQREKGVVAALKSLPPGERLADAALAYVSYLGKTLWPSSLAVFYPLPRAGVHTGTVIACVLLLAGVTAGALLLAKRAPWFAFGWFWYLGTLVPVIGLVQVGMQATADRYTYMPLAGIFIAVAWGAAGLAQQLPRLRAVVPCIGALWLTLLFPVTCAQTAVWHDSKTLFSHAAAVTDNNYLAHFHLGIALAAEGRTEEAIAHYEEAVRMFPGYADARTNLAIALVQKDRPAEALVHFQEAVRLQPDSARAWNNLGLTLGRLNRWPEALASFQQALRIDPEYADAHLNAGAALDHENRTSEALEHFNQALRIKPHSPLALDDLGLALARMNRFSEAVEPLQRAVRLRPDSADVHCHLGLILMRAGRPGEAREHLQQALRLNPALDQARAGLEEVQQALQRAP